jgi:hypothetical protein
VINKSFIPPDQLLEIIGDRTVYIWGARHEGYATATVVQRNGFTPSGFIDSSLSLKGTHAMKLLVELPDIFFQNHTARNSFIIIASGFYADEISERCLLEGYKKQQDFMIYGEMRRFNYQIDVSGSCNLHCISCPQGNMPDHRKPGFMSALTYRNLISKIVKEDPYTGIITLYNWGEPLLNKELPEIVSITNEFGLQSAISSNISLTIDFEPVIKAKPTWFRISNSGWGDNYEITHTGGKWNLFLENCHKLSEYKKKHHPEMLVEWFFHIYEHNRDDYPKVQALCDELGFTLRYRHAALAPLDNIANVFNGYPMTEAAIKTRKIQFLKVEEVKLIVQSNEERSRPCFYEDHLWINWDCRIAQCMEWYRPGLDLIDKPFLDCTLDELVAARNTSTFCESCKKQGIHRAYCVYGDEKLITQKNSIGRE